MTDARENTFNPSASRAGRGIAAIAAAAMLLAAPAAQAWEPESEFAENSSYIGLAGVAAITNFGSKIGQNGSRPLENITSASDSGGIRFWIGHRPIPYLAFEVGFQYIAPIKIRYPGNSDRSQIFSGSLDFKGYPLARVLDEVVEGRIQPFLVVAPTVTGMTGTNIQSPLAFSIGVGAGVDYWLDEDWSLSLDGRYTWGTSNLNHLDFATIALGARYHFY